VGDGGAFIRKLANSSQRFRFRQLARHLDATRLQQDLQCPDKRLARHLPASLGVKRRVRNIGDGDGVEARVRSSVGDYAEILDGVPSQHDGKGPVVLAELVALGNGVPWPNVGADSWEFCPV
jgi:hypothetical protein